MKTPDLTKCPNCGETGTEVTRDTIPGLYGSISGVLYVCWKCFKKPTYRPEGEIVAWRVNRPSGGTDDLAV